MISLKEIQSEVEEGEPAWKSRHLGLSPLLTLGRVIYKMRELTTSVPSEPSEMFVKNEDSWLYSICTES